MNMKWTTEDAQDPLERFKQMERLIEVIDAMGLRIYKAEAEPGAIEMIAIQQKENHEQLMGVLERIATALERR